MLNFVLMAFLHIRNRIRERKPSRDFKFSSKTGAYRIIECRIVERRLREFLKEI